MVEIRHSTTLDTNTRATIVPFSAEKSITYRIVTYIYIGSIIFQQVGNCTSHDHQAVIASARRIIKQHTSPVYIDESISQQIAVRRQPFDEHRIDIVDWVK